jgi:hypothetical protein
MRYMIRFSPVYDSSEPCLRTMPVMFKTKEEAIRQAVTWDGWRRIESHYGRHEEPPSCLMVIEPVDRKHPLTIGPGLTGSLLVPGESMTTAFSQPVKADKDVPDDLKAAYYGEYNYL